MCGRRRSEIRFLLVSSWFLAALSSSSKQNTKVTHDTLVSKTFFFFFYPLQKRGRKKSLPDEIKRPTRLVSNAQAFKTAPVTRTKEDGGQSSSTPQSEMRLGGGELTSCDLSWRLSFSFRRLVPFVLKGELDTTIIGRHFLFGIKPILLLFRIDLMDICGSNIVVLT